MPPGINSPIGGRTFSASSGPRTYEVPDATEHQHDNDWQGQASPIPTQAEFEAEMRQRRMEKATGTERLSPGAKQRVEMLSGIFRLTKDVTLGNSVFSIRTLKSKEMRASLVETSKAESVDRVFVGRINQLARALYKIDGNDMEVVVGSADLKATIEWIEELDESLVAHLFEEFAKLNRQASDRFSIKTEADMKEVVEDTKK